MFYIHSLSRKQIIWVFVGLILTYFVYHTYHGERGLIAQESLEQEYAELKKIHKDLKEQRMYLQNKIHSLGVNDGQIDADLLTENAKKMGYVFPDEIMITE